MSPLLAGCGEYSVGCTTCRTAC